MAVLIAIALQLVLQLQIVNALTIDSVNVMPSEIAPGESAEIEITLRNNFDRTLSDIEVKLDLSSADLPIAPYDSASETSIKEIKADRSKTISFGIISLSDAKSGIYKIPVEIKYVDNSKVVEKQSLISVTINSPVNLEVALEDSVIIRGRNNILNVRIINNGLTGVKLLTAELDSTLGAKILSGNSVYVGEIESDDFDSVEFKIFVNENAPSILDLPVKLTYKDAANKEFTEIRSLEARTYKFEEAVSLGLIKTSNAGKIALSAVIVIILLLIYRFLRRKLRQRQKK